MRIPGTGGEAAATRNFAPVALRAAFVYPYHRVHDLSKPVHSAWGPARSPQRARRGLGGIALFAASCFLVLACKPGGPVRREGCGKDTDCKGERICQSGACVEPPVSVSAGPPAAAPTEERSPAPGAPVWWTRGGPGGGEVPAAGPTRAPRVAWEVPTGAVILARATLWSPEDAGPERAYVGNHAGRFVGVWADGPEAGKVDLDLTVGGMIWGSAAAAGGRLYVGADDDHLYAIDPRARAVAQKWRLGDCKPTRAPGPEGARCDVDGGPTVGPDGDLYVGADGVYRLGPDGTVRWHVPVLDDKGRKRHVFSTPLVTRDAVFVGAQGGAVLGLGRDGSLRFRLDVEGDVDGSPAMMSDGTVLIGGDDGKLRALDPDGKVLWTYLTGRDIRSAVAVGPEGRIYVTSFDGSLHALGPDGEPAWVLATGGVILSSPVIDPAGNVFFGSQDDRVYGVSPAGKVLWALRLPGDVDATVAISRAGTLVVGCDDGVLRGLVDPARGGGGAP